MRQLSGKWVLLEFLGAQLNPFPWKLFAQIDVVFHIRCPSSFFTFSQILGNNIKTWTTVCLPVGFRYQVHHLPECRYFHIILSFPSILWAHWLGFYRFSCLLHIHSYVPTQVGTELFYLLVLAVPVCYESARMLASTVFVVGGVPTDSPSCLLVFVPMIFLFLSTALVLWRACESMFGIRYRFVDFVDFVL